ncbi:hypothetical protein K502DRAFT_293224, partial [Neoconidiobolus thromboides FSU 785]
SILAATGMTIGTVLSMSLLKPNAFKNGLKMGANWGMLGLVFFTMRNNMSARQDERNFYKGLKKGVTRDTDDLYISTISGMATGGLMSGLIFGSKKIAPGMFYYGLGASALQMVYTTLNNYRKQKILNDQSVTSTLPDYSMKNVVDSILTSLPESFPVSKVDDKRYLTVLEDKLNNLEQELAEVNKELTEINPILLELIKKRPNKIEE